MKFFSAEEIKELRSLEISEVCVYIEIPEEVAENPELIITVVIINDSKYAYLGQTEAVYPFVEKIMKDIEELNNNIKIF